MFAHIRKGGPEGFQHVLNLVEEASEGLVEDIRQQHLSGDRKNEHHG